MKFLPVLAAVAATSIAGSAYAASVITFDGANDTATFSGTNNLTGYTAEISPGVFLDFTVTLDSSTKPASGANLFDSQSCTDGVSPAVEACTGNDDGDLVPSPQGENCVGGNILIIQETGTSLDDDIAGDGVITFTLNSDPAFSLLGFSAIDEGVFELVSGGWSGGTLSPSGNGVTAEFVFGTPSPFIGVGDSFTINYTGSGGVDSLVVAPIPLPAALPLLLAGLGGLTLVRRRSKTA